MSGPQPKTTLIALAALAILAGAFFLAPVSAGPVFLNATPGEMATATNGHPVLPSGATFHVICSGGCTPKGTKDSPGGPFFPTSGTTFALQSSGSATGVDNPPQSNFWSFTNGSPFNGANDVMILRIDLNVPAGHNTLVMDFQFLSEEYPEYVGSCYNDSYILELDSTTWMSGGCGSYSAPNNFAKDQFGNDVNINTASMAAANGVGTAYDGGTCKLTATKAITPGLHTLFVTIYDATDSIFDTASFYDNLRTLHLATPAGTPTSCAYPEPPGDFDWLPAAPTTCDDVVFTVTLPAIPGPFTVNWNFGDSSTISVGTPSVIHKYTSPGLYTVSMSLLETLTGQVYAATKDVNVVKCVFAAKTPDYIGTVGIPIPIEGKATGAKGDYTCGWSGWGEDASLAIFSYFGACSSSVIYEYPGEYEILLTVTDPAQDNLQATAVAKVLVMPDDPEESEGEAVAATPPGLDGVGSMASFDVDGDGIPDSRDKCISVDNDGTLRDIDGDGRGDLCDDDRDGDGAPNDFDSCDWVADDGLDTDADLTGDACDEDDDSDDVPDYKGGAVPVDNCRVTANLDQGDLDGDLAGDVCDDEADGDTVLNLLDAFWLDPNEWSDLDGDGIGDNADPDDDNDGLEDTLEEGLAGGNAGSRATDLQGRSNGALDVSGSASGPTWMWAGIGFLAAVGLVLLAVILSGRRKA